MHIRKDGRIVDEQRDDRRAEWLAVRADLVINVGLREANVLGRHRQIPEFDQLFGRRTSDGGTSLDLSAPSSCGAPTFRCVSLAPAMCGQDANFGTLRGGDGGPDGLLLDSTAAAKRALTAGHYV